MSKNIVTSPAGGRRQALNERWDKLPGGWLSLREVAAVSDYGAKKHEEDEEPGVDNWKKLDNDTEQAPLNHMLAHALKSLEFSPGSPERILQLAQTAWNALAAIWFEKQPDKLGVLMTAEELKELCALAGVGIPLIAEDEDAPRKLNRSEKISEERVGFH